MRNTLKEVKRKSKHDLLDGFKNPSKFLDLLLIISNIKNVMF